GVFFKGRRRHTRSARDWSSDVCSSDLESPERTRPSTRRDGELKASRLGRPILRIRESRGRLAATDEQHDEDRGEDPRDGAGELQIGRAACRERVEMKDGAGEISQKQRP